MSQDDVTVTCAVNITWTNAQGANIRKVSYKCATLRLIRNEFREMFVDISAEKSSPTKLKINGIVVHKKFMSEGKASIKFNHENCIVFLSNAPPGPLMIFLKTLFVKMTGGEGAENSASVQKTIRTHMLSGKPAAFEDISPITNTELTRAQKFAKITKSSTTTPSPPPAAASKKRRLDHDRDDPSIKVPAAKKLYNPSPLAVESVTLNDDQNEVLQACLSGKNVFFTGSAGTGKSLLLKKIIQALPPDGTVATASTGVAACLIGGVTLHSFAGVGDGEASLKRCYELASRPASAPAWRKCKRLIIDEISMVDGAYFQKIESVARYVRKNDKPFGGIQLILCGDFFQLPPVTRSSTTIQSNRFCFQSDTWQKVISVSYELKIVHRQKDSDFVRILNLLRIGHVSEEITNRLLATSKQKIESNGILATQLCSHTNDANLINESKLEKLPGELKTFDAQDSDPMARKQLDSQVPAPGKLELKIGAQVMLLKNINIAGGLVNGARGIIVDFKNGTPSVRFKDNREYVAKPEKWIIKTPMGGVLTRKQIPLKLAWAFSIHKSQGLTLDCVEMSLSKVFEAGQAYVALSRAQSLNSVRVLDFDSRQVWANPDVLQFYKMFRRHLHDRTMIPLGSKTGNKSQARKDKVMKLAKSLMNKPLVNIC